MKVLELSDAEIMLKRFFMRVEIIKKKLSQYKIQDTKNVAMSGLP